MRVIKKIDGRKYLMRDQRPVRELRRLHAEFRAKYKTDITMHEWLLSRGKAYQDIR